VSLLEREVQAFNAGVRSGDWSALVELFADDAELEFVGIPVGPFRGREAIARRIGRSRPTTRSSCSTAFYEQFS
jgi:steroid Delta-isomerase